MYHVKALRTRDAAGAILVCQSAPPGSCRDERAAIDGCGRGHCCRFCRFATDKALAASPRRREAAGLRCAR